MEKITELLKNVLGVTTCTWHLIKQSCSIPHYQQRTKEFESVFISVVMYLPLNIRTSPSDFSWSTSGFTRGCQHCFLAHNSLLFSTTRITRWTLSILINSYFYILLFLLYSTQKEYEICFPYRTMKSLLVYSVEVFLFWDIFCGGKFSKVGHRTYF